MYYINDIDARKEKVKQSRKYKIKRFIALKIDKLRAKIMSFFVGVEENKEFYPEDIVYHNRQMIRDPEYKKWYYRQCLKYKVRYKILNFIVDLIVVIIVFSILILLGIITGVIAYYLMYILVFSANF